MSSLLNSRKKKAVSPNSLHTTWFIKIISKARLHLQNDRWLIPATSLISRWAESDLQSLLLAQIQCTCPFQHYSKLHNAAPLGCSSELLMQIYSKRHRTTIISPSSVQNASYIVWNLPVQYRLRSLIVNQLKSVLVLSSYLHVEFKVILFFQV
jgi:hypothetical protein